MILFNNELLFVHNPKTAGTSLIRFFEQILRGPIFTAGVKELGTYHPHLSLSLGYACAKTNNRPEDFKVILTTLRNPYDREVSLYHYYREVLAPAAMLSVALNDSDMEKVVYKAASSSFAEYLDWLIETRGTCDVWRSYYYYVGQDLRAPDKLRTVNVEHIDEKLSDIISEVTDFDVRKLRVPRLNAVQRSETVLHYDSRIEEIIFRTYDWAFEMGRYDRLCVPPASVD